jgi:hypothetical protein
VCIPFHKEETVRKIPIIMCLLAIFAVPEAVHSQTMEEMAPPIIVMSQYKCDPDRISDIMQEAELQLPYWEELKAAGKIWDQGMYVHQWADEWNIGSYIVAADMESAVAANGEANEKFAADHPDVNALGEACPVHRDNFYMGGVSAEVEGVEVAEGGNPTLVLSFYQCDTSRIGEVLDEYAEHTNPVYEELIRGGKLRGAGSFSHIWADEWNVGFFVVAEDIPTFIGAWEESGEMLPEGARTVINDACPTHKDGFYVLGPRTGD